MNETHELQSAPTADLDMLPNVTTNVDAQYYPVLDRIREHTPVVKIERRGITTYTFLRHEAVRKILQDPETFTSAGERVYLSEALIPSNMDPPEHTKWRRLLQGFFAPKAMRALEGEMRQLAQELVGKVAQKGSCDFVADFGKPYPTLIFATVMGLPKEEMAELASWEAKVWEPPERDPTREISKSGLEFLKQYIAGKISECAKKPNESVISRLLESEVDGRKPTDNEVARIILLLCLGGFHTTKAALSRMMLHLAKTPEHRALIAASPDKIPTFIEEVLRAYSLGETFREVKTDTILDGCPLRKGDVVAAHKPSANRDPRVFEAPNKVDPERSYNPHLAFGSGPHTCLGMHLARADMRIALEEWHKRIPNYSIADGAVIVEQLYSGVGPYSIPLTWHSRYHSGH